VSEIPAGLVPRAIEDAVVSFIEDSRIKAVDKEGLYRQTLESIANITIFKNSPQAQFWLAVEKDGTVAAWALTHVSKAVDNRLTFFMSDAWVSRYYRAQPAVKHWYKMMVDFARKSLCNHLVVVSSRHSKAYCRFLGAGWHPYVSLLKKEL
jgi:hypothetical protein